MGENTDLTNRFTDMKDHLTDRFNQVNDRFDQFNDGIQQMVTKAEHTAEIGRLDANYHNLRDAHNKHVTSTTDQFQRQAASTTDQLQRQAAITTDQFQKLGATIRWTLGFAVSFVGLSVAILKTIWP